MNGLRTSNPIISIITDNNNNKNNDNNNNSNNDCNNYNDSDNDSNNKILIFSSGGGGKCSHQLRPSGFKIFVGKYNSFYAEDLVLLAKTFSKFILTKNKEEKSFKFLIKVRD